MTVASLLPRQAPAPLGARVSDRGVSFALFSEHAERVELCLFDAESDIETRRVDLTRGDNGHWSESLPDLTAGSRYGYRVHGPWDPEQGHRFNPHKLLLDPYARRISGPLRVCPEHYAFVPDSDELDTRDSAPVTPRCIVCEDLEPQTPLALNSDSIIYEAHLRGLTIRHPALDESVRGTFAGMADDQVIDYLRSLGITAVELLPVHFAADESRLTAMGLSNYWRYNSLAFFAPDASYGTPETFRALVQRLHDAGIEVILDVVYNHTAEGDHLGPNLCFRGIDNSSYYRLSEEDPRYYVNDTGCGNTLDVSHPRVRELVLDSLRYWASRMGVDGFRFDLATTLGREAGAFDPQAQFFTDLATDPVLQGRRLIAEPWDVGAEGYRLGQFPAGWHEWNDRYRDVVRRYWRGDEDMLPELARRLHGSGDLFEAQGRQPAASVNFITSHDGFTLADLVSYSEKHNQANGEDNRDGHDHNFSDNYGVEGPSDDPQLNALRLRQRRNMLATLLLSQGTPMLTMGDELGRSQAGNNNAYCQDNEASWFDWSALEGDERGFLYFVSYVIDLRKRYPLLSWPVYIHNTGEESQPRCRWFDSTGELMQDAAWHRAHQSWLGKLLTAPGCDDMLLLLNGSGQNIPFQLPANAAGGWLTLLDTANRDYTGACAMHDVNRPLLLRQRSLQLLKAEPMKPQREG